MTESQAMAARTQLVFDLLSALQQWGTARAHAAGEPHGLSLRQFAALYCIRKGASSPGELARLWQVTPAVLTGIIDRLERRGLVQREPDPVDRRRLRLVLTASGLDASQTIQQALTDDLAAHLTTIPAAELAELDRSLALLRDTLAALHDQIKPATTDPEAVTGTRVESRSDDAQIEHLILATRNA
jgi:DNA-binding MarR family transcriptional regulator